MGIEQSDYFDSSMVHRQVMSWTVATRLQLDRWEPLVARSAWLNLYEKTQLPGALIWQAQFEHHFLLIACRNLVRALDLALTPVVVEPNLRADLIAGRDLHEHWDENMPVFNVKPRKAEPPRRSGQGFAERNPGRGPYWWLGWSSSDGPRVLPNVPASILHDVLDAAQAWVDSERPEMAEYRLPRAPSPWLGPEAGNRRWWPGPQTLGSA
jgi:hypothetical protein